MDIRKEKTAETLFERGIIDSEDLVSVKAYRSLGIFSLHNELLMALYAAVLMFSGGIGILIYKNIDTIGHTILIALTLVATVACFYFSFRKAPAFAASETFFENPVFDYVVLLGTLLSGTFFGYLQYQYNPLGNNFAIAALLTSAVGFAAAYRFDNRSSLSIAITAFATTLGIAITPMAVVEFDVFEHSAMFYTGIALGVALIVWAEYSQRTNLKAHFAPVFYGFALHLVGICCIVGLCQDLWPIFLLIMAGAVYYFFVRSHEDKSVATFVFVMIYGYIAMNISLVRLLILSESSDLIMVCAYLAPIFYGGSIVLFIKYIRNFNKAHK